MKPRFTRTRCTKNYDQKIKSTIANSRLKFAKLVINVDIQMRQNQIARVAGIHGDVRAIDTFPPSPRGKRFKTNQNELY